MKIEPRYLRMRIPTLRPGVCRLFFLPRGNSLQLQETGLILQGYRQRLSMPLLDLFFRPILCEWSTLTIPYSCILSVPPRRFLISRTVLTMLGFVPCVVCLCGILTDREARASLGEMLLFTGLFGLLGLLLTYVFNFWLLLPRFHLRYEQADGQTALLSFRIKGAARSRAFHEQIERNRKLANRSLGLVAAPPAVRSPLWTFFFLAAYLVLPPLLDLAWRLWLAIMGTGPPPVWYLDLTYPLPASIQPPSFILALLAILCQQAPVLLLALLLWSWHRVTKSCAVMSLILRGLFPLVYFVGKTGPSPSIVSPLFALLFYGVLALFLALTWPAPSRRGRRPRGNSAEQATLVEEADGA